MSDRHRPFYQVAGPTPVLKETEFSTSSINFLGRFTPPGRLEIDSQTSDAMSVSKPPTAAAEPKFFLGSRNMFGQLIRYLAHVAVPLENAEKTNQEVCTITSRKGFPKNAFKTTYCLRRYLSLTGHIKTYTLDTDAPYVQAGCALL